MKTVNGIELLKMMKDKDIKQGTKIYILYDWEEYNSQAFQLQSMKFYTLYGVYRQLHIFREIDGKEEDIRVVDTEDLLTKKFVIIEEQQDIDIQEAKELDIDEENVTKGNIIDAVNDILIWAKQLDKKIKNKE